MAHAGLVNIMHHIHEQTGLDQIYADVSGLHLASTYDEQFIGTVSALRVFNIARIGVGQCTGLCRSAELLFLFPRKTFFASVVSSLFI